MTIEELRMLAKARSIDSYENMSRKQLESIFTTPSTPKPNAEDCSKTKKRTSMIASRPKIFTPTPTSKSKKHAPTSISIDD